ncbi:MarR family transcriptional regulator [Arthrobacter sp. CAU 1506]|uniref:MarR family winged helix-turn-helix transcriptional regulator n=1 Tax=Arthrobacter sp. CAU 1506 TaxID=2560052 RepID=UPI0010AC4ECD|nr:MarR family transcriptional regulator [Arthrobacter sp. CAU 1506]TJY69651.1 MarR family transcriptional regulator [Arthrobacter sp. CAU 1506]
MTELEPLSAAAKAKADRRPLLGLILTADRRLRALMDEVLQQYSLPTPEYTALVILRRQGPLSSAELARLVFVTPQAMGQIITSIERRNLIIRHPDPNHGRKLLAELTPVGVELVDKCVDSLQAVERHFLGALNEREQEYFLNLLSACTDHLEQNPNLGSEDRVVQEASLP